MSFLRKNALALVPVIAALLPVASICALSSSMDMSLSNWLR